MTLLAVLERTWQPSWPMRPQWGTPLQSWPGAGRPLVARCDAMGETCAGKTCTVRACTGLGPGVRVAIPK